MERHGGFITASSTVGTGTVFQVNFPAEIGPAEVHAEELVKEIPRGNGETVLIIEDEAAICSITGQTLEAYGYRVLSAGDGAEGVVKYVQHVGEVAIVLIDMIMPVMDGFTTIRALLRINPQVRIIAASGSKDAGASLGVNKGVKRFLQKPYTAECLLRMLDDVMKGREVAVSAVDRPAEK